jgi:hypothetical protein
VSGSKRFMAEPVYIRSLNFLSEIFYFTYLTGGHMLG